VRLGSRRLPHAPDVGHDEDGSNADLTLVHCFPRAARNACIGQIALERAMDISQLKLLAARVRNLLQQSECIIGHNQSLDVIAALPGLRNWPEVQAFHDRVSACELDEVSIGRLSFRLRKKFEIELPPKVLFAALRPQDAEQPRKAPQIWPTGPAPGVYVTTSQSAIDALLECFEDASDGSPVYSERAGSRWRGSIDLSDGGLWSNGLERLPSGTLFVVGPLEFNQQSWEDSAGHLEMACLRAQNSAYRVAVLIETPTPETVCEDALLMVRLTQAPGDDSDEALLGIVTENGDLQRRYPFAQLRPSLPIQRSIATPDAIPPSALRSLKDALKDRTSGLLLFGSVSLGDHMAIDLVAASLALTEHVGPAARIMPRNRSTPQKDWFVPDAIKELPFLPSIESAYEQGYRRIIYTPGYTRPELLLDYSKEALLIAGAYGSSVMDIFMATISSGRMKNDNDILARIIAILSVTHVPTRHGPVAASDLVLLSGTELPSTPNFEVIESFLKDRRTLRWEDEMEKILSSKAITASALKKAFPRSQLVNQFLRQRASVK